VTKTNVTLTNNFVDWRPGGRYTGFTAHFRREAVRKTIGLEPGPEDRWGTPRASEPVDAHPVQYTTGVQSAIIFGGAERRSVIASSAFLSSI